MSPRTRPHAILSTCLAASLFLLAGCGSGVGPGEGTVFPRQGDAKVSTSEVISGLRARRSSLPPGTAEAAIAHATLSANTGPGRAELRLAHIKSDIENLNWLPTVGPNISLSALDTIVSSLLLDVVIYDNGRKRAEREHAVADVEVAAVNLAIEANDRVKEALSFHVAMLEADNEARIASEALHTLQDYADKIGQRVASGYSADAERAEVDQSLSEMRVLLDEARQEGANARQELAMLGVTDVPRTSGALSLGQATAPPLSVALAKARANRSIAEAKIERAEGRPSLGASTTIGDGSSASAIIMSGSGVGVASAMSSSPFEASSDAARQSVIHATNEAARQISSLTARTASLTARARGYAQRIEDSQRRYALYRDQFSAGTQGLTDVVDAYTALMTLKLEASRVKYDIMQTHVETLHAQGVLFDGSSI